MVSRRCGVLLVVPLSLWIAFFGGKQACGQQGKHEVPRYDEGGTFKTTLDVPAAQRIKMSGEIRAFIWEHWSEHRRGKLQIIAQSIEGQVSLQKIFIEPAANGHWRVRDEEEADIHKGVYPAKPQMRIDEYDEVRRIDMDSRQTIPASQKRTAGTYQLLLLNSSKGVQWAF